MRDSGPLYAFDCEKATYHGILVGLDEAGRGPLAGPVVSAAVILDLSVPITGIFDSKKVPEKDRETLYNEITARALAWSVGLATHQEIDTINILQASLLSMERALSAVTIDWKLALIDGNQYIHSVGKERQCTVVKGDGRSASIAAASIIAKVTRDRIMADYHNQYPEYGFIHHKGYATEAHRKKIVEHGLCTIHRKSFCDHLIAQTRLAI